MSTEPYITPVYASLLVKGIHRFATCWKLERTDGTILRFTDHDTTLKIGGFDYTPASAPLASAKQRKQATPQNSELRGALNVITEDDLRRGKFRGCKVTEFVVDFKYPFAGSTPTGPGSFIENHYIFDDTYHDGETWRAVIRGKSLKLMASVGRVVDRTCWNDLGDEKCGVDLGPHTRTGEVLSVSDSRRIFTIDIQDEADGWYEEGVLTFTSGDNNEYAAEIMVYSATEGGLIELYLNTPGTITVGDTFSIVPGCKKRFDEDCGEKYANKPNFGGFPHSPTTDETLKTPTAK